MASQIIEDDQILRQRNEELETELNKSLMREEKMKRQLEKATQKLYVVEVAEERLCSELGDLEAEALEYVRSYEAQIQSLNEQLSKAQSLLQSINPSSPNRFYNVSC